MKRSAKLRDPKLQALLDSLRAKRRTGTKLGDKQENNARKFKRYILLAVEAATIAEFARTLAEATEELTEAAKQLASAQKYKSADFHDEYSKTKNFITRTRQKWGLT